MTKFRFYAIKLSGIIIIVFLLQRFFNGFTELFVLNHRSFVEVWRFFTAIFLHGGAVHLFYNLFALVLFGSILERLIGSRNFLVLFFATGILANIISVNFYESSLGASGAIFGVIGALIFVRPGQMVWAFGLPMPIFIAGILWAVGDVIGIFMPRNVANIAHLSGMFFGIVLGALYKSREGKRRELKVEIDEGAVRKWERSFLGG